MVENKDKRKFLRASKSLAVEYREEGQEESSSNRTFLQDISVGGGCIITYRYYDPGHILSLRISIPVTPKQCVDIRARVIKSLHDSGYRYSTRMQFLDINREQKNIIHEFVEWAHSIRDLKR